ncbi:TPA: hypothetical protein ACH3X3_003543 [Trebouxia sp. C0006]
MNQALASAPIVTQQKVIANPPTFVKIARKFQRRASTPALSISNGSSGRAGSLEVSSNNLSGPGSSASAGSIGVADFMDPEVLKTAKLWRCQKLSKAELVGLVEHYTKDVLSAVKLCGGPWHALRQHTDVLKLVGYRGTYDVPLSVHLLLLPPC